MVKMGRWVVSALCCALLAACGNGADGTAGAQPSGKLLAQSAAAGAADAAAAAWVQCAPEGQACAFAGTREVRYGANGVYTYKKVSGPAQCDNAVFGDPVPGADKFCSLALETPLPAAWSACAAEDATCTMSGTRLVRYGAANSFAYRSVTGAVQCSNAVFDDPLPGVDKACSVATDGPPADGWIACAAEDQQCGYAGLRKVRYGAAGSFAYRTLAGPIQCSNAVFGDPLPGVDKSCSYAAALAQPTGNWAITDLGTLGGDETAAAGLNDSGSVVGWSRLADGTQRAFLYRDGQMRNLGVLAGDDSSQAVAINSAGAVVGRSAKAAGGARMFSFDGSALGEVALPFSAVGQVEDINDGGDILISYYGSSNGRCSPIPGCNYILRKTGASLDLQTTIPRGLKITNGGVVMAFGGASREPTILYKLEDGSSVTISSIPGGPVFPYYMAPAGINSASEVVGLSGYGASFLYRQGAVVDIATVIGPGVTYLNGINDHGDIVGSMQTGGASTVFFYGSSGNLVDLNTLAAVKAAGWTLQDIKAVNNAEQILGHGTNADGKRRAFLLTPR